MSDEKNSEKNSLKDEVVSSFRGQLQDAFKNRKRVNIYSSGTYKGVSGMIISLTHTTIILRTESEEGEPITTLLKISDIKRLSIYG